jgi:hypothetical protein
MDDVAVLNSGELLCECCLHQRFRYFGASTVFVFEWRKSEFLNWAFATEGGMIRKPMAVPFDDR